jgi:hypothetical protein
MWQTDLGAVRPGRAGGGIVREGAQFIKLSPAKKLAHQPNSPTIGTVSTRRRTTHTADDGSDFARRSQPDRGR